MKIVFKGIIFGIIGLNLAGMVGYELGIIGFIIGFGIPFATTLERIMSQLNPNLQVPTETEEEREFRDRVLKRIKGS